MSIASEVFALFGYIFRFLGFLVAGYGLCRFFLDNYKGSEWQVRVALALGFFGLFVGVTAYAGPGSSGAFAIGASAALIYALVPRKDKANGADENKTVG